MKVTMAKPVESKNLSFFGNPENGPDFKLLANSFKVRICEGKRSFGVGYTGHNDKRLLSIFGALSHLDIEKGKKVAVITQTLFKGQHPEFFNIVEVLRPYHFSKVPLNIYKFKDGIDFIDFNELVTMAPTMAYLVRKFDYIFWEIPCLDEIKMSKGDYYPYLVWLDSVDLLSSRETPIEDIEEVMDLFRSLGVQTTSKS